MPRRLDPQHGLDGVFAKGRPKGEDLAFLVGEAPRAASGKARAKKPARSRTRAAPPPVATVAASSPPSIMVATATMTTSDSWARPVVRTPPPDPELAALLRDAPPPVRVPEAPRARLGTMARGLATVGLAVIGATLLFARA